MDKPNFLCVGTQKAGTSSIHAILKQHSQIFLPRTKELHFFDREENYTQGIEWYSQNYSGITTETAIGEVSHGYLYSKNAPERIMQHLGKDVKLLFSLRNPADRAFSNYKMIVGRGLEKNKFKKAIKIDLKKIKNSEQYAIPFHYINRGFYYQQIQNFLKIFPKENMFFILFENDFLNNRKHTFEKIYNFLGVEYEDISVNVKITPQTHYKNQNADKILNTTHPINQFAKKIIPSKKLRTNIKYFFTKLNQKPTANISELEEMRPFLINEVYKESILNLEKLIDRDLSSWYKI